MCPFIKMFWRLSGIRIMKPMHHISGCRHYRDSMEYLFHRRPCNGSGKIWEYGLALLGYKSEWAGG